jgi:hypothetical protein
MVRTMLNVGNQKQVAQGKTFKRSEIKSMNIKRSQSSNHDKQNNFQLN